MPATFCFAFRQSKYLNKFKLSLCTILNIIKVCIMARNTKNIYDNFHFYFYLKKTPPTRQSVFGGLLGSMPGTMGQAKQACHIDIPAKRESLSNDCDFRISQRVFSLWNYSRDIHRRTLMAHTVGCSIYNSIFSCSSWCSCPCCYCNILIWTTKAINIKYLLDTSSSENSWGPLDVCVMYVNIFQVFCLFSITSGGNDWLCAILLPLWACECQFLYLASLCLCVCVCVSVQVAGFDFA